MSMILRHISKSSVYLFYVAPCICCSQNAEASPKRSRSILNRYSTVLLVCSCCVLYGKHASPHSIQAVSVCHLCAAREVNLFFFIRLHDAQPKRYVSTVVDRYGSLVRCREVTMYSWLACTVRPGLPERSVCLRGLSILYSWKTQC